jgi:plastocyanin
LVAAGDVDVLDELDLNANHSYLQSTPALVFWGVSERASRKRGALMRYLFAMLFFAVAPLVAAADDMAVHRVVARDGIFEPATIEVVAGKRFKIEISNEGKGPMEFESKDLKQEKVLAKGAKASIVVNGLKPGTYTFFDEYHMEAPKGRIVAK